MINQFRRYSFLAVLFLWGALSAFSQTQPSQSAPLIPPPAPLLLSPDAAVEMAIRNNLMLQMAEINLDMARRRSNLVWNQFLPTVGVTGTIARSNWANEQPGMSIPANSFGPGFPLDPIVFSEPMTLPRWNVVGNLSASLDFSFALIEGIRSIHLNYQAGIITLDKARLQMEQGIRKMYNSILLMEASAALLMDSFNNAQRQAEIAEANFRAGMVPRLTWLQAQVQVENMRPSINDLENSIASLKGNFALLLGLHFNTEFELIPISTNELVIPADLAGFITRSSSMQKPDILELQANLTALQSQRQALFYQQFTPFLRFGWTLSSTFNPRLDPFSNSWFTNDNWNEGGNFSITLGMSLNSLFGFTREGQQLADMDANIQLMNIRLAQSIRETDLEIFSKLNSLESTRASIEIQDRAVDLAEESYRLTEEAYRAGLQDFQSVQNAALALEQARHNRLTQYFNFINDLIDLEYSLGVPFGSLSNGRR